jgi:hypothetical protein
MRSTKQFQENTDFRLAEPPLAGPASAWHPRKPEKSSFTGFRQA